MNYKENPELFLNKCLEYFEIIEQDKEKEVERFSDGTYIKYFFYPNYIEIMKIIRMAKYKQSFPHTYEKLSEWYYSLKKNHDYSMTFEEKCIRYFEIVERYSKKPSSQDKRVFKNGSKISNFWICYADQIYKEICKKENKKKFPKAYKVLSKEYKLLCDERENRMSNDEKNQEVYEFIEKHQKAPKLTEPVYFSNGKHLESFFRTNIESLYEDINSRDKKKKYPKAFQIIAKEYKRFLQMHKKHIVLKSDFWSKKKTQQYIMEACKQYKIDVQLNEDILNFISYKELIIKINYLLNKGDSIVDDNGKLHPIFRMSNNNMQQTYNVSVEQLMEQYINNMDLKIK